MYFEEKPYKRLDDMLEFTLTEIAKQDEDESTYRACAELIKDAKKHWNSCSLLEMWNTAKIEAGKYDKVKLDTVTDCMAQIAGNDFAQILDGLKRYRLNRLGTIKMLLDDIVEVASPRKTNIDESKLDKSFFGRLVPLLNAKRSCPASHAVLS